MKNENSDLNYEKSVIMCANDRLQVYIRNIRTDEDIKIDENINDVRELYYTLRQYFITHDNEGI